MQIHSYHRTGNLGDAVQTIALRRLLGDVTYTDRDSPSSGPLIVNGWLGDDWASGDESSIYTGLHLATEKAIQRIKGIRPAIVGARDAYTLSLLRQEGIHAEFVGCATMTLPRYDGPRKGKYAVDFDGPVLPDRKVFTHKIDHKLSWEQQLTAGGYVLDLYRQAEVVFTSRLHVALPCLAFGTKVYLEPLTSTRFTMFDLMGLRAGWMEADLSEWGDRFKNFLTKRLKLCNIQ